MRVGIDIGATKTEAVALDLKGHVVQRLRVQTGSGSRGVLQSTLEAVTSLAALPDVGSELFDSIGVGVPGLVDRATGTVAHAVNLGVVDLDLGRELSERFRIPAFIDNDVNAAALGAYQILGQQRPDGASSMGYLNLGTGTAAGLVLDGKLWRGSRGNAGEIGHIPIDPTGPVCACGQRGCLEMMVSATAVVRQWPTHAPFPVQALFEAAEDGDGAAIEVRDRLLRNIAAAVRVLVLAVDVDFVVIGGGLSLIGEPLMAGTRTSLTAQAAESPFLAAFDLPHRIELVPSDFPAGAVGAALLNTSADSTKRTKLGQRGFRAR